MKQEVDRRLLVVNKNVLLSVIGSLKELSNKETDFNNKVLLGDCVKCLRAIYNSLEEDANKEEDTNKTEPIKLIDRLRLGISTKS